MRLSKYLERNIGDGHSSKHLKIVPLMLHTHTHTHTHKTHSHTHTKHTHTKHIHTHTQNTLVPDQLSRKSLWYCTSTCATCTSGSSHVRLPQGIKPKLALKRLSAIALMWAYCFQWLATDIITPDI